MGKSTLLAAVAEQLARYETIEEPYHLLEEEGYEHEAEPSVEDFTAQLERSLQALEHSGPDVLFDRAPADLLAYLLCHEDAESFELHDWIDRVRDAMQTLDLVVFVPIERPDRIALASHEDRRLRARVHKRLERVLLDDVYDFSVDPLVAEGSLGQRRDLVLRRLR